MTVLDDATIATRLDDLPGWRRDGGAIVREYERGDFVGAVDFVNALTPLAEAANHHPDLSISWKTVTVSISTHSEGGLTDKDFDLAAEIDSIA